MTYNVTYNGPFFCKTKYFTKHFHQVPFRKKAIVYCAYLGLSQLPNIFIKCHFAKKRSFIVSPSKSYNDYNDNNDELLNTILYNLLQYHYNIVTAPAAAAATHSRAV